MLGKGLKIAIEMFTLTRAERALTLGIFLLFQAMLPSYAGVLSAWSGEDRLVICTAHGLFEISNPDKTNQAADEGTICIVAQAAAADFGVSADLSMVTLPLLGATPVVALQLQDYRRGLRHVPQSPRAPPFIST